MTIIRRAITTQSLLPVDKAPLLVAPKFGTILTRLKLTVTYNLKHLHFIPHIHRLHLNSEDNINILPMSKTGGGQCFGADADDACYVIAYAWHRTCG